MRTGREERQTIMGAADANRGSQGRSGQPRQRAVQTNADQNAVGSPQTPPHALATVHGGGGVSPSPRGRPPPLPTSRVSRMAASFGRSLRPMAPLGNTHVSADRRVDTSSTFHPSASIRTGTQPTCFCEGEKSGGAGEWRCAEGGGRGGAVVPGRVREKSRGQGSSTSEASKHGVAPGKSQPLSPSPTVVVPAATPHLSPAP